MCNYSAPHSHREHRVQEGKVVFPLGVSVQGDVVVSVYHMRSTIGGRLQAKVESLHLPDAKHCKFIIEPVVVDYIVWYCSSTILHTRTISNRAVYCGFNNLKISASSSV